MKNNRKIRLFFPILLLLALPAGAFAQGAIVGNRPAQNTNQNPAPAATTPSQAPPSGQNRDADHEALRALLRQAKDAVNNKNFDALKPLFHNKFSVTTVEQKLFTDFDEFKNHFAGLFTGPDAPLKSITFNPEADALTEFVGDNIGLSYGSSTDTYNFTDGDTRTMTSRWTATLIKDNGRWKILNLHIGTNLLDNPVTEAAKSYVYKVGIAAGLGGLLLGFLITRLGKAKSKK